jgi:hypothetical protein
VKAEKTNAAKVLRATGLIFNTLPTRGLNQMLAVESPSGTILAPTPRRGGFLGLSAQIPAVWTEKRRNRRQGRDVPPTLG